jgi:enoyl-CoA hydratase
MMQTMDLSFDTLHVNQFGRVLTVRYVSRPHNFVTPAFIRDLDRLTKAADHDDTVGAIVLTGGIPGRFLTHADADALSGMDELPKPPMRAVEAGWRAIDTIMGIPGSTRTAERFAGKLGNVAAWGRRWKKTVLRMNRSRVVYIAAINGPTLGGGHEIALACDLRYAADSDDIVLGQIEILAGLIPGGGGTQRLPRMIGTSRAIELMLEGAPITARQAHELGLVHRLVPAEALVEDAQATAARLSRRSPLAVAALKRAVYFDTALPLPDGMDREQAAFVALGTSPAAESAFRSFSDDIQRLGDTPFLADPQPWIDGTRTSTEQETR